MLISTLLAAAISTPISGRLGDMYGKRRMELILLGFVVAGCIISALSSDLATMVVGRTLQGIGLGVIALGISILRDVVHPKSLPGAISLVSATLGVGGALGLPLSAIIVEQFDWHVLFWLGAVLGLLALVAVATIVPVSTLRTGGRFDFVGAIGLAVGTGRHPARDLEGQRLGLDQSAHPGPCGRRCRGARAVGRVRAAGPRIRSSTCAWHPGDRCC